MKSGKQRRQEIRARRIKRALAKITPNNDNPWLMIDGVKKLPQGYILADAEQLLHNTTYSPMPLYYTDRAFVCATCGDHDLWTAKQQKWWYEIAKGNIETFAIHCRPCRIIKRRARDLSRKAHFTGLIAKKGMAQAAKQLNRGEEDLEKWVNRTKLE